VPSRSNPRRSRSRMPLRTKPETRSAYSAANPCFVEPAHDLVDGDDADPGGYVFECGRQGVGHRRAQTLEAGGRDQTERRDRLALQGGDVERRGAWGGRDVRIPQVERACCSSAGGRPTARGSPRPRASSTDVLLMMVLLRDLDHARRRQAPRPVVHRCPP
jgi:hypothetical protein